MNRNYLEQLQFKKQAKKAPTIELDFSKKAKQIVVSEVSGEPKEKVVPPPVTKPLTAMEKLQQYKKKAAEPEQKKAEVKITDLRGTAAIDYELILKRLHDNKITGVTNKAVSQKPPIVFSETVVTIPKHPIKKTTAHVVIESPPAEYDREEEGESSEPDENDHNELIISKKPSTSEKTKLSQFSQDESDLSDIENKQEESHESEKEPETIDEPSQEQPQKAKRGRKKKTELTLPPGEPIIKTIRVTKKTTTKQVPLSKSAQKLTKSELVRRLPKQEKLVVKTSQYYLNNRKLFIQKIKELFKPYEKELAEMGEIASCAKDSAGEFSLLTHQKIVRDYLNLFTPYRGLLLYHGLGSGKTCTSIGIAEGMKSGKQIILMTPASLKTNFFTELKKCGDSLYRKNQFWEFVGIEGQPDNVGLLSTALSLPATFIEKKRGAWMVDVKKPPNFKELSTVDQENIDEQIDMMIRAKYTDIHYNGMNRRILDTLTQNKTVNPFDNKTVIIDEVHNFVSRIVNKLSSKKTDLISKELYEYLLKAQNARIVALSGTPIINSPHELSVLFNILRGTIRTWTIPVRQTESKKIDKNDIIDMLANPPQGLPPVSEYDYVDYTDSKVIITRNPIGFVNTKRKETRGGENETPKSNIFSNLFGGKKTKRVSPKVSKKSKDSHKKTKKIQKKPDFGTYEIVNGMLKIKDIPKLPISDEESIDYYQRTGHDLHKDGGAKDEFDKYTGIRLNEIGQIDDEQFINTVKRVLRANGLEVLEKMMKDQPKHNLALPDNSDQFEELFLDVANEKIKNDNVFKRRILGLTSYFRSAQESLLPSFIKDGANTYHVVRSEMSEPQLHQYMAKRERERQMEKNNAKRAKSKGKGNEDDVFNEVSTYRIGSREVCNFIFPDSIERPEPDKSKAQMERDLSRSEDTENETQKPHNELEPEDIAEADSIGLSPDEVEEADQTKDTKYMDRIKLALKAVEYDSTKPRSENYLTKEGMLPMLTPKLLDLINNIQNPQNEGLHLVYSQFRHIEGIGILKLILEANGYAEFKIRSVAGAESWELVENEEDVGKPKFALYTGTESEEEKEIIRNIYNGDWGFVPKSIVDKLTKISANNLYGEIIKVLMITAAGAEGINLRNTRFVHITEPYWHNTRLEQVIGRARRICSHESLPEELRTIQVFLYVSVIGEELLEETQEELRDDVNPDDPTVIETTDEYLLRRATKKDTINKSFLKAVKESAMDCTLYKNKEGLVCYGSGMIKNPGNQFLSYPEIEQDLTERDDLNVAKKQLKLTELKVLIKGVKYAIDKETEDLYDLEKYKRGEIVLIGRLIRPGKGKRNYEIDYV